jgi:hypothetical protein
MILDVEGSSSDSGRELELSLAQNSPRNNRQSLPVQTSAPTENQVR